MASKPDAPARNEEKTSLARRALMGAWKGQGVIEQAIYGSQGGAGYRFLARSPGFREEWLGEAERLCTGFGERPAGVSCPGCVFARPFGRENLAVVQVADQGADDAGRPGALGFRLLVLPRRLYEAIGGDPFFIADRLPPPWPARGELPALEWTAGAAPPRTVAALQKVLEVPNSATLLGGVQALLDGGRLVFERTEPDERLVRSLWALLPASTRIELWPASFCFGNAHGFSVAVVPRASGPAYAGYLHEEQAGDYPEGRYELALQTAIESGDQHGVDALFARRSRSQTMRLALALLAVFAVIGGGIMMMGPTPAARQAAPPAPARPRPELLPADKYPPFGDAERQRLAKRLHELGQRLRVALPAGTTDADLTVAVGALDAALDARQGGAARPRDPGPLADYGAIPRQLRALLWKHEVAGYKEADLNTLELLERLEQRPAVRQALKDGKRD
jgi:hypothetical protein